MHSNDASYSGNTSSGNHNGEDAFTVGDAMLSRAKDVSRRITERIRRLTDETRNDHRALSDNPTEEHPPTT